MRKTAFWIFLSLFVAALVAAPSPQTARTRLADGFDQPVGKPNAEGYYMSRGFRANYHMGEDWNGLKGGNSDVGAPVYSTAHGYVVMARDVRMGWGNLVIVRHTFLDDKKLRTVDSVYAHLDRIMVREGQQVVRGQQVGTIGTNRGMYTAHLHFEIRKNLFIGFNQRGFGRDLTNYYAPGAFIAPRRKLAGGGRSALVAINTFNMPAARPGSLPDPRNINPTHTASEDADKKKSSPFRVNRFGDSF
jgi:murein DD-endopeptidase MepM/ murein hydrolase activator NlpD